MIYNIVIIHGGALRSFRQYISDDFNSVKTKAEEILRKFTDETAKYDDYFISHFNGDNLIDSFYKDCERDLIIEIIPSEPEKL